MYSSNTKSRIKLYTPSKYSNHGLVSPKKQKRVSPLSQYNPSVNISKIAEVMLGVGLLSSVVCLGIIFAPMMLSSSSKTASAEMPTMRIVTNYLSQPIPVVLPK